jgi:hypothetical protein
MSKKDSLIQQLKAIKDELLGSEGRKNILEDVKNKIKNITPELQKGSI